MSGGQRLKVLKNGNFLILPFLSLNEGVRGRLSPDKQSALATFKAAPQGGGSARGVMKNKQSSEARTTNYYIWIKNLRLVVSQKELGGLDKRLAVIENRLEDWKPSMSKIPDLAEVELLVG